MMKEMAAGVNGDEEDEQGGGDDGGDGETVEERINLRNPAMTAKKMNREEKRNQNPHGGLS